jgi:hypothetical protein
MIHVFYVPGMFGSTIEYVLRTFTREYDSINGVILPDGSMHSYNKEMHLYKADMLSDFKIKSNSITTPIYPFRDLHLPDILDYYNPYLGSENQSVLIYANDLRSAELNILFQYYKICRGVKLNLGLDIFFYGSEHNIINWNPKYTHWSELQLWELREWFSLFYVEWVQEWIHSKNQVSNNFFKIVNTDLLYDTETKFIEMFDHCGLTPDGDLGSFVAKWQLAQQYIVDEFNLLDQIIDSTTNQQEFSWQSTHVIAEAIVQQRLRENGYEIRCDGLNSFPTDSETLYKLLEKC